MAIDRDEFHHAIGLVREDIKHVDERLEGFDARLRRNEEAIAKHDARVGTTTERRGAWLAVAASVFGAVVGGALDWLLHR